MSIVDARDVALAIVKAIDHGQSGERFVVGGGNYPVAQIISSVAGLAGRKAPSRQPPMRLLLALAHVMGALSKLTGKPAPLRVATLERLQQNLRWDSSRAEKLLSVGFRPLDETLRDTVRWFSQELSRRGAPKAEAGGRPAWLGRASA